MKDKNKDQQGKGDVHMTQPPTHQSRAPRRHQTKPGVDIRAVKGEGHVMLTTIQQSRHHKTCKH
jgi:hypothetical protein